MRYTDMFEQYKGYGETIKGLRDALEPIKGLGDVLEPVKGLGDVLESVKGLGVALESVKGLGDALEPIKGLRDAWAPITGYQSMIESAMSARATTSNMRQLVNDQVTFLSQNYSGMETLLSQADRMLGFYGSDIEESMKSALSGYAGISEQLNYSSVYQNIVGLLDSYGSIKDVVDSIYSSLPPENYGYEGEEYESEESVIEENAIEENVVRESAVRENAVNKGSELETDFADEQELQEALEEESTDQDKFLKRIKNWAEEKKMKYKIYKFIMFIVVNVFLMPYLQENIGKPVMTKVVSCVKQAPEKGAEIIYKVKDGIQAIITENTNYYYKVRFTDENGVEREGYVAKKNLRVIEEEERETEQKDDDL